ncbi:MAG: hypothetical protein RIR10_338, partial [Planctomycetota bacterium]
GRGESAADEASARDGGCEDGFAREAGFEREAKHSTKEGGARSESYECSEGNEIDESDEFGKVGEETAARVVRVTDTRPSLRARSTDRRRSHCHRR